MLFPWPCLAQYMGVPFLRMCLPISIFDAMTEVVVNDINKTESLKGPLHSVSCQSTFKCLSLQYITNHGNRKK